MTLYWWTHWFWITVCGVVLIECTPLSSIDTFPSKLSKLEENNNKSTYLKRAGEPTQLPGPNGNPGSNPPARFISSLPPVAAASSGLLSSSSSSSSSGSNSASQPPQPTINSLVPDLPADVDDTFAGGSLAGTDFGPDVIRYTRKDAEPVGSTVSSVEALTAMTATTAGRLRKNGTIFTRNEQNITTLKLKNYNRGGAGVDKEELKVAASTVRVPDRGTRLVDTLMQVAVENGTSSAEDVEPAEQVTEVAVDLNVTESALEEVSAVENVTVPVQPIGSAAPTGSIQSIDFNSSSSSSTSFSNISDSDLAVSSGRELPDSSHSDSSGSSQRIGKILSSDFRDFVSPGGQPNASSYIAQSIAFSTQNLQEGVDDQDHPLEDDDYRRSSRSQSQGRLNVGAISGICLASLGLLSGLSAALVILYRRYLYLNKPQALSEPDSSGYIDDSTIRDNSDEMYSLDNDSFLNSLEAMTIQNYWTDNVKHTKL